MAEEFNTPNGWNVWAQYVLKTLEDLKDQTASNEIKIADTKDVFIKVLNDLKVEGTKNTESIKGELKVINSRITLRATLVGALAGIIPAIGVALYFLITYTK